MYKLADYYQRAMISQDKPLGEDCYVYSLDGHPYQRKSKRDMASNVGLPSCQCCDCFIFEKESISIIEITDISRTKKNVKEEFSYLSEDDGEHFFRTKIVKKNILKMYGSMVVLCWFARDCKTMANNLKKKYKFWLVNLGSKKDVKGLDRIQSKLNAELRSVTSCFVIEAVILFPEDLEEKIKENAISV